MSFRTFLFIAALVTSVAIAADLDAPRVFAAWAVEFLLGIGVAWSIEGDVNDARRGR
ncbi:MULTISPECIES: hypothetical protein [Mycobacteroides]|uniref:hypothetical protein n=1 Tax=Mycobacteroides TaxID=670516 RepID=UPI0009CC37F7|nr:MULTISPECIES: hypothetical protein [Mycobacteroides]SKK37062.1 Uncharacterised protein [Mycobacteroides abscessus subsp. massiliense]SKM35032.1 Uncharacterised protein [Mycobacteroides abscessus subsp. massiliense]SKP08886.1 Uncharacterised protein [Mycobacteroides abscessus subsp. massiliense]SKP94583.1 Uncharacterised protein [Mycobacteroides abscessus subsp. massiliense]SLK59633.1 Uncharacterised protein [Mycobacteroides abscessus subsp. massiliense]